MKRKLRYLILMLVLSAVMLNGQAQNLTDFDKSQIVRRAQLKMDEFEELLFLISDPTRSRGAVDRYILSSYSREDSLFNQVFYNGKVMIEDDISPIILTKDNIEVSAIDVVAYLNNFKLQYNKYVEKTVFFTDMNFSEVVQEDYVYVVASYQSEFRGRNTNYKDLRYQPVKRKATLRAEYNYETDAWQVWIAGVNFDRADSKPGESISALEKEPLHEVKSDTTAVTVVQTEKSPKEAEPVDSQIVKGQEEQALTALQFTSDIPESMKRGKNIALKWDTPVDNASLSLYRRGQEVMKLRQGLSGQQWNWDVQQKPGKGYSIMLYDPKSNRSLTSETFRIKRKIPLGLYVGIGVTAATVIYFLLPDKPCEGPDCNEELAEPPGLPSN
jgi:hypothetical protein